MAKSNYRFVSLLVMIALVLSACGGGGSAADSETAGSGESETSAAAQPADESSGESDRVQIRWFVGLGTGSDESMIEAQEAVVNKFNESQDEIELVIEIIANAQASDILKTQIASGNAPDIIGPVGIAGRAAFTDALLDLSDQIASSGYDLGDFDPALVDFYKLEGVGQIGLPFAIFPSFIFVNKDLFDEAGLPYPPQEYGAPYIDADGNEREWNIDTLRELALLLTVDGDGNDATSPDFDPDNIVQFGFGNQFTDLRGRNTLFGADKFVDADGNAVVSEHWAVATQWYYDAMWKDFFHPNGVYGGSDMLGAGNWFESGNLAMANVHLWYATCCMGGLEADWDTAVVPSYNGQTTAKMHADTFSILKSTDHPQEAFTVLSYLIGDAAAELAQIYGGMPARLSLQDAYFGTLSSGQFADQEINWDVVVASMAFPDNPNHEEGMPSELEARDRLNEFTQYLDQNPDVDVAAELEKLAADLQAIFDAAQ